MEHQTTAAVFPGGLALAALGGRSGHWVGAYRVGYQVFTRCPDGGCADNPALHLAELIDEGVIPEPLYGNSPLWNEIEDGFEAGWRAAKAESGNR